MKKQTLNSLKIEKILWFLLLISSTISLLLVLPTYIQGGDKIRDPKWVELIIIPFYFTIQSNFLAFFNSLLVILNLIKNKDKLRTLLIYMATNLVMTFFVYWIILFPNNPRTGILDWMRNLTLHTSTPLLAVVVFIFKYLFNNDESHKQKIWTRSLYHLIYPLVWLIVAIAIYFILGADPKDAIYVFLDFKTNLNRFLISFFGMTIVYYLVTVIFIFISNPKNKK